MDYIDRMPTIISLSASILIGFISYYSKVENGKVYIILSISLVVFFIVGLFVKSTLQQIIQQISETEKQKLEEEKRLEEENNKKLEEKKRSEEEMNLNTKEKTEAKPSFIDYSVGDDDGFIPFQFEKGSADKEKTASVK